MSFRKKSERSFGEKKSSANKSGKSTTGKTFGKKSFGSGEKSRKPAEGAKKWGSRKSDDAGSFGEKRSYKKSSTSGYRSKDNGFGENRDGAAKRGYKKTGSSSFRDNDSASGEKRSYRKPAESSFRDRDDRSFGDKREGTNKRGYKKPGGSGFRNNDTESGEKRSYRKSTDSNSRDRDDRSFGDKREGTNKRGYKKPGGSGFRNNDTESGEKRSYRKSTDSNSRDRDRSYGDRGKRSFDKAGETGRRPYGSSRRDEGSGDHETEKRFTRTNRNARFSDDNKPRFEKRAGEGRSQRTPSRGGRPHMVRGAKARDIQAESEAFLEAAKPEIMRLNRYISNAGICSRREADDLIAAGLVSVNGEIITEMGYKVNPGDEVRYNNERLNWEKKVYLIMNKPKDTITTSDDPEGRKIIMDLINDSRLPRVYPVGRLDRNTTGVILLTNDGEFAQRLTHPKYNIAKVYRATLNKNISQTEIHDLANNGVELEDGMIAPDVIGVPDPKDKATVMVQIHSGRNRIIHRMFEALGYLVDRLDRMEFAGLDKKGLERGEWRHLTEKELKRIKKVINLK